MQELNCPNCGDAIVSRIVTSKVAVCASCDTSLILDGGHVAQAGTAGVMHDAPCLLRLGEHFEHQRTSYAILGHARFDYGQGWWDEFWTMTEDGEGAWVSVDEGDVVIQKPVPDRDRPDNAFAPKVGTMVKSGRSEFIITERSKATCLAIRGEFPEMLNVGQVYTYINCRGSGGELLSGEFSTGAPDWYFGHWIDPYQIDGRPAT
ncbi:MAG: DUF4178 domain-containing protein [Planktomarina sp.]